MKPNLTPKFFSTIAIMFLLAVTITSCQKSSVEGRPSANNQEKQDLTNDAIDASTADEDNFDMVMDNGDYADAADAAAGSSNVLNGTAKKLSGRTVTYSPSKDVYPHTKTIDFGSGWTNSKGVTRSGKVMITYYAPPEILIGKYTITTYGDNYYCRGLRVEGSVRIDKLLSFKGETVYLHTVNKKVSDATGSVKAYVGAATWTLINWHGGTKNAYNITEYTTGSETYNGAETSIFITSVDDTHPVIKPLDCTKRVQGILTANIHLTNAAPGQPKDLTEYLNYGNGDCDTNATLSVNGGPAQTVTLPLSFWPLNL